MFVEDLDVFFNADDFASVFTVNAIGHTDYRAIFDTQYVEYEGMVGERPVMLFESVHYSPVVGDAIAANGDNYTVAYFEPPVNGVTRAILERV